MSVAEAYQAIPHRRTVFDYEQATMPEDEKIYLHQMFAFIDLAIVERVKMLLWLSSPVARGAPADNYDNILSQIQSLKAPGPLQNFHNLVHDAISEQHKALDEWQKNSLPASMAQHPLVQSASSKLHEAYSILLSLYPQESQYNKEAFFDYLCALDFI